VLSLLRPLLRPFRRLARASGTIGQTVASVPEVFEAILFLPKVSQQLEVVAFQTATLADMHEELARVRGNTASLPRVEDRLALVNEALARIDANTQAVERLAEVALPLSGAAVRLGRFADRLPQRRIAERAGVSISRT
jgi:hypothetical protein